MLGRSANGIFWLFRYLERAENTARLIEAGFRMALTRDAVDASDEWRSLIVTLGLKRAYAEKYGTEFNGPNVFNFILRDRENPGSVLKMTEMARTNARMVRAGITREVWESVNDGWMRLKEALARPVPETRLGDVLDMVRRQATQVRGAMEGTMLRNEIYNFARIGSFIERADNTARILDVKDACCCRRSPMSGRASTTCSGKRCFGRSPGSVPTAGSTPGAWTRAALPSFWCSTAASRAAWRSAIPSCGPTSPGWRANMAPKCRVMRCCAMPTAGSMLRPST